MISAPSNARNADVAIVGGGLAGLSLAYQLSREVPEVSVVVVDQRRRPAPERTGTVGESFSELGSHYLRDVLGLHDHLDARQLPKLGLRFFVGDAWDFADRFELGVLDPVRCEFEDGRVAGLPLRTHQVDRGRLENELARRCADAGVGFVEGTCVDEVRLDPGGHRLVLSGDEAGTLDAAWVVSASGGALPGLPLERRSLGHRLRSAWLRVEGTLDVGSWSTRPAFLDDTLPGFRRLSTNHLMGAGYWIWIIPLPTGVTSVGVVVDPQAVDFGASTFPELTRWLSERDPRLARELSRRAPVDGDLHVVDVDAFVTRSFSDERWAVVGGSASFVDVLYSPGADLIALGNTLLTDIVRRDRETGRVAGPCAVANRVFEGFADGLAEIYRGQYPNFGSPEIVGTKAVWDSALYFGFNTLLFRHGLSCDARFLSSIQPEILALKTVQSRVQSRFRSGRIRPLLPGGDATLEWGEVEWMMEAYYGAREQPDERAVAGHLRRVVSSLERVARHIEGGS